MVMLQSTTFVIDPRIAIWDRFDSGRALSSLITVADDP